MIIKEIVVNRITLKKNIQVKLRSKPGSKDSRQCSKKKYLDHFAIKNFSWQLDFFLYYRSLDNLLETPLPNFDNILEKH